LAELSDRPELCCAKFERHRLTQTLRLFLCGDVMTGRGIDQALPYPCDPSLHESYVTSAADYVRLAEGKSGPIPKPVKFSYIWGDALAEWRHARIVNLETSITRSEIYAHKGINYRMSPENAAYLVAAGIDCCVLANNHVLDWGHDGLTETLDILQRHKIKAAGAGRTIAQAKAPAVLDATGKARVLSFASVTSGTPRRWAATAEKAGVALLPNLSRSAADAVAEQVEQIRKPGDIVVVSIHWGPNWGYEIPDEQRSFAHRLLDQADVSIVHGHSSHHPKAAEVYKDRLVLYGCGDFLNDYEGIAGYQEFRGDLAVMYFVTVEAGGRLTGVEMVPLRIKRFHLNRASAEEATWLQQTLDRETAKFGARIELSCHGLELVWDRFYSRQASLL
jgi:poly-gamma-glutamate synthesis protein (capsule biosynthesis protein)